MSSPASILADTFAAYEVVINSGKHEEAAEFYHPDGVLVYKGKQASYGKAAVLAVFQSVEEMMGASKSTISDQVFEGSENYIMITAKYETKTEKIGVVKGNFSQIWKKENGKWLIVYDIFDDNL